MAIIEAMHTALYLPSTANPSHLSVNHVGSMNNNEKSSAAKGAGNSSDNFSDGEFSDVDINDRWGVWEGLEA